MSQPNWEAIRTAFEAGDTSIRKIAEKYGVTDGAIRKRAKKDEWQRHSGPQLVRGTQSGTQGAHQPKKVGAPTVFDEDKCDYICAKVASGQSLRSICKEPGMPSIASVLLWVVDGKHKAFSEQYRMAREAAGYAHADRIIDCIDRVGTDPEHGGLDYRDAKVMMDGLKWAAERMASKAYGPRQDINHTSDDGSMTPSGLGHFYGGQTDTESGST